MNLNKKKLNNAINLIKDAISTNIFPCASVAIGDRNKLHYVSSFGYKSLFPTKEDVNIDTIFDLASLTKVMCTTTLLIKFMEKGLISIHDKVNHYTPYFNNKNITIKHLLTHTSGLTACIPFHRLCSDYENAIDSICNAAMECEPGSKVLYSDLNFILLGYILETIGNDTLDNLTHKHIFSVLGMDNTCFNPTNKNAAAVELNDEYPYVGVVHDENARFFGGVSGHAGLFSTVNDVAIFANMLINKGNINGKRFISEAAFNTMVKGYTHNLNDLRGLGWALKGDFDCSGGDLLSPKAFGHTGFTGTSLWVDPEYDIFIVLLTNRVHPTRANTGIVRFRRVFHNAVLSSIDN